MTKTKDKEKSGNIGIHTENILPIIKKWLYSENEIFVRELISNAHDAIVKLQKINTIESLGLTIDPKVTVTFDEKAKTITISDNGLGMNEEEIEKYISQIAFSGAEDFIEKYKDKDDKDQVIGHFGLGFYSSFIVSDKVEINTLSYKKGSQPVFWSCDGSTEFKLSKGTRKTVGTDIIMSINDESKEYLNEHKLTSLIQKYANFIPVKIFLGDKQVNDESPLWIKTPSECKDEDYKSFYSKLFPMGQEPLFWIHLNVDYPFNLKGVLYFPKLLHELDANKGNVKLFCQQVFVTDEAKGVIPEFLTLLQGAIDCPEIPLNVSRSYLQNDPYLQKISAHIVKKIADKLSELYKKDKAKFETYWSDIHPFIKYGMMQDTSFYEKVKDIVLFDSSSGYQTTVSEYTDRNKEKLDQKVLYCLDKEGQSSYVNMCKENGLEVLFVHAVIDSHFIQFLEGKMKGVKFCAVDSDLSDLLVDESKSSQVVDKDNKTADDRVLDLFKSVLKDDKLKIECKSLKSKDVSAVILQSEESKRLEQMSMMMKGAGNMPSFASFSLVLNSNNDVIKKIQALQADPTQSKQASLLCEHVYDLAKMSHKPLTGEQLQAFLVRSSQLLS